MTILFVLKQKNWFCYICIQDVFDVLCVSLYLSDGIQ